MIKQIRKAYELNLRLFDGQMEQIHIRGTCEEDKLRINSADEESHSVVFFVTCCSLQSHIIIPAQHS